MNKNITISYETNADDVGERLDTVIAREFSQFSRAHIQKWIKEGNLLLNGEIVKPKKILKADQHISIQAIENPVLEDGPENIPIEILSLIHI